MVRRRKRILEDDYDETEDLGLQARLLVRDLQGIVNQMNEAFHYGKDEENDK
jgi:hypothetical protein